MNLLKKPAAGIHTRSGSLFYGTFRLDFAVGAGLCFGTIFLIIWRMRSRQQRKGKSWNERADLTPVAALQILSPEQPASNHDS